MSKICTICARGGSKGVKSKNIKLLLGKPLIAHTILQAKKSGLFDIIAVSSDSEEILDVARRYGADILIERPPELATDQAAKLPVIQHCLKTAEERTDKQFDVVVDMDATSPLRTVEDIKDAVSVFEREEEADNLITGSPARRNPYFNLVEESKNGYITLSKELERGVVRRQDAPKCYDMNASIYIWRRNTLLDNETIFLPKTILFEMPESRSVDIDSELDFQFVSFLAEQRGGIS